MEFKKISLCGDWFLATAQHGSHSQYACAAQIEEEIIPAKVPGNLELDLFAAGKVEDLFWGTNPDKIRRITERMHCYYFKRFVVEDISGAPILRFDGLDCYADVYLNGVLVGSFNNMLVEQECQIRQALLIGENEIFVHIYPAVIAALQYDYNPLVNAGATAYEQLYVRKPPHMYGWDIMPRYVSAGIWKSVEIRFMGNEGIVEYYLNTTAVEEDCNKAFAQIFYKLKTDIVGGETLTLRGQCGESIVEEEWPLIFPYGLYPFTIENPKLWWPRSYGEPNRYDWELIFKRNGQTVDSIQFKQGLCHYRLDATEIIDEQLNGEFQFYVNNVKIYCKGTNWVAADPFHSRDKSRIPQMLQCAIDCNCNMIRCWGGNVYEDDLFYELCDANGIMVWQDFGMACAKYPQDGEFAKRMEEEAIKVIKRLRGHSCIALWSGDNESDSRWFIWESLKIDPNSNKLTRQLLPEILRQQDPARPYLPSSPFVSPGVYRLGKLYKPEEHYYGWRVHYKEMATIERRFKFVSEFGIMAAPSPDSVKKFIPEEYLWENQGENDFWRMHSTSAIPEYRSNREKPFRIGLHHINIAMLFDEPAKSLADFARKGQIYQLEAMKYTAEYFRGKKWEKTGLLWWNLIDGWPQFSDAVIDYYFDKKLAYYGMAQSQQDVCFVVLDGRGDNHSLVLCNETAKAADVAYTVKDVDTDEILTSGSVHIDANSKLLVDMIPPTKEQRFLVIQWSGSHSGKNHFLDNNMDKINVDRYIKWLRKSGIYETWVEKQELWGE